MSGRTIIIVRHGRTQSNAKQIYAGRNDEPLTAQGAADAERLVPSLQGRSIGSVVASPVRRAVQTAEILARPLGLSVAVEPGLTEIRMGPWRGLSETEVRERFPEDYRLWVSAPSRVQLAGRETLADVQARAVESLGRILTGSTVPATLVVTHVAVIRCLALHFQGRDLDQYKKIDVPNLSIWTFAFDGGSLERFRSLDVER